jgi:hypothetical protein
MSRCFWLPWYHKQTPPQEIDAPHPTTSVIIKILNPYYIQWLCHDSLILTTINASLTKDILTQVMSYTTCRKVWLALERTFSLISPAKAIQIRIQLANARKGACLLMHILSSSIEWLMNLRSLDNH